MFLHSTVQIHSYILEDDLAKYACLPTQYVSEAVMFCGVMKEVNRESIESFQIFP